MESIEFQNAYYIKLGKQGKWEQSSIEGNKARIGWGGQTLDDINERRWDVIGKQLIKAFSKNGNSDNGAVTRDLNALKIFAESKSDDIWITFYESRLWWCRLKGPVRSDEISKYRSLDWCWSDCDTKGNRLLVNQISGRLSKVQRFQGTICKVREKEDLHRLLNHEPSRAFKEIEAARENLITQIESGLRLLHWRDFETLIDLLFTNAGWRRLSVVGKTMKYVDMEYEEPITKELYQVQVKSAASLSDFKQYQEQFSPKGFKKLYFVVHSPSKNLVDCKPDSKKVELVLPERLAQMTVNLGLTDWLSKKIR